MFDSEFSSAGIGAAPPLLLLGIAGPEEGPF